jgi:hypothetical protein
VKLDIFARSKASSWQTELQVAYKDALFCPLGTQHAVLLGCDLAGAK